MRDIILLDDLTENNLGVFKKINSVAINSKFSDSFYSNSLVSPLILKLAYFSELPIAAIRATPIEIKNPSSISSSPDTILIDSIATLPSYQNLGVGKKLINFLIDETKKRFIHKIAIYINESNSSALAFFENLHFSRGELIDGNYLLLKNV